VIEAFDWQHGTFLGATASSETTAAAAGNVGQLRRDPMAMLPFCGYHMGDYFQHWLEMGRTAGAKLPRIFYVNWFRQDGNGNFLWPGFGENSRVLKWVFERCEESAGARQTSIGLLPEPSDLDLHGLLLSAGAMEELLSVDEKKWLAEISSIEEHFARFGDRLPSGLQDELKELQERLRESKAMVA
jgi:phosphoenolpyruvate carboxykinase (GTP)